jgi:DNA-binding NarL/FixJ family response regulator
VARGTPLNRGDRAADNWGVDAAARYEILNRYAEHVRRFEEVAVQRNSGAPAMAAEVIPLARSGRRVERRKPTKRELEVLRLISDGLTSQEIGERLHLSEETIRTHVRTLLAVLQVHSRAHAVAIAFRRGILD